MSPRQNYFFDRIKVLLNNNSNNLCSYSKKNIRLYLFFVFVQIKQTTLIYNEIIMIMRQKHIKLKEKINIIIFYILCLNPHPTLSFYVYDYFCYMSLILAGADCTHLHSRSLLNFCLLLRIILQAAFTSALISFPFNVLYNPRLILFPLNSYFFCFF